MDKPDASASTFSRASPSEGLLADPRMPMRWTLLLILVLLPSVGTLYSVIDGGATPVLLPERLLISAAAAVALAISFAPPRLRRAFPWAHDLTLVGCGLWALRWLALGGARVGPTGTVIILGTAGVVLIRSVVLRALFLLAFVFGLVWTLRHSSVPIGEAATVGLVTAIVNAVVLGNEIFTRRRHVAHMSLARHASMLVRARADGVILDMSDRLASWLMVSREAVLDTPLTDLAEPASAASLREMLHTLATHPSASAERPVRFRAGGGARSALVVYVPVFQPESTAEVVLLVVERTETERGATALRTREELEQRVAERTRDLERLAARLESVREEERRRIAREVHDELGQLLTGIRFEVDMLRREVSPPDEGPLSAAFARLDAALDMTLGSVRRIVTELRPELIDELGFVQAAQRLIESTEARTGIVFHGDFAVTESEIPRDQVPALYRILQEAVTNVVRHAGAESCVVRIRRRGSELELSIEDDGRGLSVEGWQAGGLGLLSMQERAHASGGTLLVEPGESGGTCVRVTVPCSGKESTP